MIVFIHVLIALTSLAFSGLTFFIPTKTKLRISYALIALTLVSGTYLVVSLNSPLLAACTSGLLYLSVVMVSTVAAHHKLIADK